MRNYARILHKHFKQHMFWIFVRIAEEIRKKNKVFLIYEGRAKSSVILSLICFLSDSPDIF